jgi:hypothetical protein
LVQLCFDFYMIEAKPENLVGDRAYDSDPLDEELRRFFAWIQWQRRILVRWEYHTQNFLGFVQLACLVILFRRF